MKINALNKVNFASSKTYKQIKSGDVNFYNLNTSDKLDVIHDQLVSLSTNQERMHNFNKHAFDLILASSAISRSAAEVAMTNLNYQYDRNKVNVIA